MIINEQENIHLIHESINGNQIAQKTLYNKYKRVVESYLKKKYSNNCDFEDDVSEIMIKIFVKLDTYDSLKSNFKSWVISIAKNYMIDKWRFVSSISKNNNCTYQITSDNSSTTDNNIYFSTCDQTHVTFTSNCTNTFYINNNCTTCNTFENNSSINYISEQISPQDFMFLDMKYVQGYNYCEIGTEFNITSNTVSNRVDYIKTKLKNSIKEIV